MPRRTSSGATDPVATDPDKLIRAAAGRYHTADARFEVEQASGGWMVSDAEQTNELGLPLVRGPFATLDEARSAIAAARSGPAPISGLARPSASTETRPQSRIGSGHHRPARPEPAHAASKPAPAPPPPPPLIVREFRGGDGPGLRALWSDVGLRSLGDDDRSLRRFAQRNPGLFLVATRGSTVVASALGGWDGRRGWIYHVATAPNEQRTGIATDLVRRIEERLGALGCPKVNVIVQDENTSGAAFWEAIGYPRAPAHQHGRELDG